ncbi:hypothetical protein DACRYDRAFT_113154 [Dacryopinax primogenitus]|uniref:N1221-domain-containing protein n=1 Tax=Dacryopinax primogenitus (strain DJM 731) TaxID=1858805 RepID=M5G8A8_DACPD|nr:uncharacterized protein DACRYDRAFT_113154 [Dacryopinax primogenitus]EJU06451.1 hypothetical protein DACRYDRAFT_113154 [Dacryopinax primogenitus]
MDLSGFRSLVNGPMGLDDAQEGIPVGPMDSISLQLKAIGNAATAPPKPVLYDFRYDDEDTVFNEIEEFYSYAEVPQVEENIKAWQGSFSGEWTTASPEVRNAHVQLLLESLEHRNAEKRFINSRRLLYLLQGSCVETSSTEDQHYWMIQNCNMVRGSDGISNIVDALLIASSKHDMLSNLSDHDLKNLGVSPNDKQDLIEEVNTEISIYLNLLYHLVEVFKGDRDFGDELMSLETPLPVTLFNLVAALKEKSAKGYPVKKLLIVLWKSLLACLGGLRELRRAKTLARELAGLEGDDGDDAICKSTPMDLQLYHQELTQKYPTFAAAQRPEIPAERYATALAPIPVRPHYHYNPPEDEFPQRFDARPGYGQPTAPFPVTPAPSPPPQQLQMSGKPKKQQYQTDNTKPFVFPFSRNSRQTVPYAIEEADKLYIRHMHVSLSVYQMWKTREDFIRDEGGMSPLPETEMEEAPYDPRDESQGRAFRDIIRLEKAIAAVDQQLKVAEAQGNQSQCNKLREKGEDLLRLRRVETIYSGVLPVLQSSVVVLLKLLLATVTASGPNPPPNPPVGSQTEPPPPPSLTLEEIDVIRHREITSKAVSAILLLSLKWFKVSNIMKFHHLGQLLLDSNCLLLVLKMFGLQEVSTTVTAKHDSPPHNFFRYCQENHAKNAHKPRPEDSMLSPPRVSARLNGQSNGTQPDGDVEVITEYSWRNFFTSINFVKIMQKLSKHRSHRIWLLVQYKSSAILKRILKVSHPMLQLFVLKIIKSQVPFCGRKWRQSNMKVITSIYLNCRPELRDEWLTGNEVDDVTDALAQEQALRSLVKFYNTKRYAPAQPLASPAMPPPHRRSISQTGVPTIDGLAAGPELTNISRTGPPADADVFPPMRSRASDPSFFLPSIPEDAAFEEEYEDYLSDLSDDGYQDGWGSPLNRSPVSSPHQERPPTKAASAWQQLSTGGLDVADGISDSESIASIGELGDDARATAADPSQVILADENVNQWEHLSPKTLSALPKSPGTHPRRTSSGGTSLRPVLPFGLDDGSAIDIEEEEPELGPIKKGSEAPFAAQEGGKGVDEVEYLYGE